MFQQQQNSRDALNNGSCVRAMQTNARETAMRKKVDDTLKFLPPLGMKILITYKSNLNSVKSHIPLGNNGVGGS